MLEHFSDTHNTENPSFILPVITVMAQPRPKWGPFCSKNGVAHEDMDILVGWFCPQCGGRNPGKDGPDGKPIQIDIDAEPEPSRRAMITTTSQLQPSQAVEQLPPVAAAAQRAQFKNEAVFHRMKSIDGRPPGSNRQQSAPASNKAVSSSKSPNIATKIAFDVSYYHLVWYGNTVVEATNAYGIHTFQHVVLLLICIGGDVGVQVPSTAEYTTLDGFVDQFFLAEVNPVRLRHILDLPRTYAIKISGTMPQFFPQSAYKCTTLQELLDKIPWKESRDTRKFVVCFEEHKEEEADEGTPTSTLAATPRQAVPRVATPRKAKPASLRRQKIRVKEEQQIKIEATSARKSRVRDPVKSSVDVAEVDLTFDDTDYPARKRALSQVEEPQSTRTTPTQASVASTQEPVSFTESPASTGLADLTPIKETLPRYPRRPNRQLKKAFEGFEDIPKA